MGWRDAQEEKGGGLPLAALSGGVGSWVAVASARGAGGFMMRESALRGRGTEGGSVVHRKAAKYRHNAGPRNRRV